VRELEAAAQADPKLPFVHFNLGLAYQRKQDLERARAEFKKDLELEPDVAFTYAELGNVESTLQHEDEAAKNYRQALKLDARLVSAHMGLAKIEERRQNLSSRAGRTGRSHPIGFGKCQCALSARTSVGTHGPRKRRARGIGYRH